MALGVKQFCLECAILQISKKKEKNKEGRLFFPNTDKHVKYRSCIIGIIGHSATCLHVPELSVKVSKNNQRWAGMKTVLLGVLRMHPPKTGFKVGTVSCMT